MNEDRPAPPGDENRDTGPQADVAGQLGQAAQQAGEALAENIEEAAGSVAAAAEATGENIAQITTAAAEATTQVAEAARQTTQQVTKQVAQTTQQVQAGLQQAGQRATVSPRRAVYRGRRFATGFSIGMMVLALLAGVAKRYKILPGDVGVTHAIQRFNAPPVDLLMQLISELGWQIPSVLSRGTFSAVMWASGFRLEGAATAGTFSADAVTMLIKTFVGRPRPTADLVRRTHNLGEASFPSGHVVHYVTFYGFLFYLFFSHLKQGQLRNAVLCVLAFLVLLVGPSRVYMGAHWPSDVAAAYLVGSLWLAVEIVTYVELKARFQMQGRWPFLVKRSRPIE